MPLFFRNSSKIAALQNEIDDKKRALAEMRAAFTKDVSDYNIAQKRDKARIIALEEALRRIITEPNRPGIVNLLRNIAADALERKE